LNCETGMDINDDKLHEECGVFGVFCSDSGQDAVPMVYCGLFSLQHRGQESAGIAAVRDGQIELHKGMGLVGDVFTPEALSRIGGCAAVGHVRYSTAETCDLENAQPFVSRFKLGSIAVAHNGALTNADVVRELLEDAGIGFVSSSDSEVIVNLIAKNYKKGLEKALTDTIKFIKGSYALVVLTGEALVGARDPNGIRPLCLGQFGEGKSGRQSGWMLSSESCAIEAAGGKFVRDIEPGEVVIINQDQVLSFSFSEKTRKAVCSFEYVYFARPDSIINGIDVYHSRIRAGQILGRESAVPADLVIGVPDSGVPAAIGYGRACRRPSDTAGRPAFRSAWASSRTSTSAAPLSPRASRHGRRLYRSSTSSSAARLPESASCLSTTQSSEEPPAAGWYRCSRARVRKRCTYGYARRRCAVPAISASTRPTARTLSATQPPPPNSANRWARTALRLSR